MELLQIDGIENHFRVAAKPARDSVRNSDDSRAVGTPGKEQNRASQRVARQHVVHVPQDGYAQTNGSGGRHQAGSDTVRMNQIRIDFDSLPAQLLGESPKRSQVTDETINSPGEPRLQTVYVIAAHSEIGNHLF